VSAACKNIPYTDEAAKEARTKLFSMWYSIGPPAVFSLYPLEMNAVLE
jgi:hypothetical protein